MQSSKMLKLALVLMLVATVTSVAAVVWYTRTISNTFTIKTTYAISLWRMNSDYVTGAEAITTITWGEFDPGTERSTNQLYGTCCKIRNDGNVEVWVAWQLDPATPLPSGVTLTARYCVGGTSWVDLPENDFSYLNIQPYQFSGYPQSQTDPNIGRVEFKLSISETAVPGSGSFNILLKAADSASG